MTSPARTRIYAKDDMLKTIRNLLNGLAFGITETVPGVSGGTIAIILGFYDELIGAINNFRKEPKRYLKFLLPILAGVIVGFVAFSGVMTYLLTNYTLPTMTFFIGLIVGIIPIIFAKVKEPEGGLRSGRLAMIGLPALLVIVLAGLKGVEIREPVDVIAGIDFPYMLFLLLAGAIAAMALVVPGISGSFVLLLIGIYPLATYSISSIRYLISDPSTALLLDICKVLVPLGIGVVIGGLLMCRLIEGLLTRHYKIAYSIILGLLLGSIYALLRAQILEQSGIQAQTVIIAVITCVAGCVLSYNLGKKRL